MTETKKLQEMDLYKPIQTIFAQEGYEVYGEVCLESKQLMILDNKTQKNN